MSDNLYGKTTSEGTNVPTDYMALLMTLSDIYMQIKYAIKTNNTGMIPQLITFARAVDRVARVIRDQHNGDITGDDSNIFEMMPSDIVKVEVDPNTLLMNAKFENAVLLEGLEYLATNVFSGKDREQVEEALRRERNKVAAKNDAKLVEDFLKELGNTPPDKLQ